MNKINRFTLVIDVLTILVLGTILVACRHCDKPATSPLEEKATTTIDQPATSPLEEKVTTTTDQLSEEEAPCDGVLFEDPFWEAFKTVTPKENGDLFAVDFSDSGFFVSKVNDDEGHVLTVVVSSRYNDNIKALLERIIAVRKLGQEMTYIKFSPVVNPEDDLSVAEFNERGKMVIGNAGIRRLVINPVPVIIFDDERNLKFVGNMNGEKQSPIPPGAVEIADKT